MVKYLTYLINSRSNFQNILVLIVFLTYWDIIVLTIKEEIMTINGVIKKTMFIKELIKGEILVIMITLTAAKEFIRMTEITKMLQDFYDFTINWLLWAIYFIYNQFI